MYVLDSNTFIDAKNRYYGFDIEMCIRDRGTVHPLYTIQVIRLLKSTVMKVAGMIEIKLKNAVPSGQRKDVYKRQFHRRWYGSSIPRW